MALTAAVRRWRAAPLNRLRVTLFVVGLAAPIASALAATCTLEKLAHLSVTMIGLRPTVDAAINGADAMFIADSGAFFSILTPAAAAQYKLGLRMAPAYVSGVGGASSRTSFTTVKTFTLYGLAFPDVEFFVAGNDLGDGTAGVLGQNVLSAAGDIEYDLANGTIKLMHPKDCGDKPLAYWAGSAPYSVLDILRGTTYSPTRGVAFINGIKINAIFDTGAAGSVVSLGAAKQAGVTPDSAGVVAVGLSAGFGAKTVKTWIGPFASFKIGGEEIRNTRLRIGELDLRDADMLLGADFFLSHHVYVANNQRKIYFTYNGGPVFNLASSAAVAGSGAPNNSSAPGAAQPAASEAAPPDAADSRTDQPADAAGFAQRGAAFAARRDFRHAIADLTRACELDPSRANYFYLRGRAYRDDSQPDLAMADFDRALTLKPDDLPARLERAELHAQRMESAATIADLDAASTAAAKEADVRPQLGLLYQRTGQFAQAVAQFTLWIDSHDRSDVHMAHTLRMRCWSRGLWGQQLDAALSDCDAAVRSMPDSADPFTNRCLVRLRRGDYDRAIADCDRALSLQPRIAWAQYLRGIAKLRKTDVADGQADLAAATALDRTIAEHAARIGLTP
jgi:tetratricopeptide (TPR) repeat protein